jgi:hypothetical protein
MFPFGFVIFRNAMRFSALAVVRSVANQTRMEKLFFFI